MVSTAPFTSGAASADMTRMASGWQQPAPARPSQARPRWGAVPLVTGL